MKEHVAHSSAWGLAMIPIVAASGFLSRHFIIALSAAMYGVPLTIYLLVRIFGVNQTYLNANLNSTLPGYGETGMISSMILGYVILIGGSGIFMEGGRKPHRARQENRLVTVQFDKDNPLYQLRPPGFIARWGQCRDLAAIRIGAPGELIKHQLNGRRNPAQTAYRVLGPG